MHNENENEVKNNVKGLMRMAKMRLTGPMFVFCKLLLNGVLRMIVRLVAFNFFERELKDINFHFCYSQSLVANYRKVKALYGSYKTVGWTFRLIVVLYTIERGFIVL